MYQSVLKNINKFFASNDIAKILQRQDNIEGKWWRKKGIAVKNYAN